MNNPIYKVISYSTTEADPGPFASDDRRHSDLREAWNDIKARKAEHPSRQHYLESYIYDTELEIDEVSTLAYAVPEAERIVSFLSFDDLKEAGK